MNQIKKMVGFAHGLKRQERNWSYSNIKCVLVEKKKKGKKCIPGKITKNDPKL